MSKSSTEHGHEYWMQQALKLAQMAGDKGEVPVGALVVADGEIIGKGYNQPVSSHDPTAHAEICALRHASQNRQNYRLPGTTLYVTIEPCTMCVGALVHARVDTLVFGATEPRAGAVVSQQQLLDARYYNHQVAYVQGVLRDDCASLLLRFFKNRRQAK